MATCDDQVAKFTGIVNGVKDGSISLEAGFKQAEPMRFAGLPVAVVSSGLATSLTLAKAASGQEAVTGLQLVRVGLRAASEIFRKPELHDALLREVMETLFNQAQNADARIRAEAFRCLSTITHKYHLFSEPHFGRLIELVTAEVQRYNKTEELDRTLIAALVSLDGLRVSAKSISAVRSETNKMVTVRAVSDEEASQPILQRVPSSSMSNNSDNTDSEVRYILEQAADKYIDDLTDGVLTILQLQTGGDEQNLPEDLLNKMFTADDEYDNPSFTTPYMACVDVMAFWASFASDTWKARLLEHPLMNESSENDTMRSYSSLLLTSLCQNLQLEADWSIRVVQRTWKRLIAAIVRGEEKNPEIIGNILWASTDLLDALLAGEVMQASELFLSLADSTDDITALYEKLVPIAMGDVFVSGAPSSASLKAQSFALAVLSRLAMYVRAYRVLAGLPPVAVISTLEAPTGDELKDRRDKAHVMSQTFLDLHARIPSKVQALFVTYTAPGASVGFNIVLHAMEVLVSTLAVTLKDELKAYAKDLMTWVVPVMKEAAAQISSLQYSRKIQWVDSHWHHSLLHPDLYEPQDADILRKRLILVQNFHIFHSIFAMCGGAVTVLSELAALDSAAAAETAQPDQIEDIFAQVAAPYARMLTEWAEEACSSAITVLPAYAAYNDVSLTVEAAASVASVLANTITIFRFSPPSLKLRNGIRDVIRNLLPFMDGEKCEGHALQTIAGLIEAATSISLLSESDLRPFLDMSLRNLTVAGEPGRGFMSSVRPLAVASSSQCAAICVATQPTLLATAVDKAVNSLDHAVKALEKHFGTPQTEVGIRKLVRQPESDKYYFTLNRLLNILGGVTAGYADMQESEKEALKGRLNDRCRQVCDIIESIGKVCLTAVVWYSQISASAEGEAPLDPNYASAITDNHVMGAIAAAMQTLHTVGIAFVNVAEIVAADALREASVERLQSIIMAAQETELLPMKLSYVLVSKNLRPYEATVTALDSDPHLASAQLLAAHLINLGMMNPDLQTGAQLFVNLLLSQAREMGVDLSSLAGQAAPEGNNAAPSAPDAEEEAHQRQVASREVREDEVD